MVSTGIPNGPVWIWMILFSSEESCFIVNDPCWIRRLYLYPEGLTCSGEPLKILEDPWGLGRIMIFPRDECRMRCWVWMGLSEDLSGDISRTPPGFSETLCRWNTHKDFFERCINMFICSRFLVSSSFFSNRLLRIPPQSSRLELDNKLVLCFFGG